MQICNVYIRRRSCEAGLNRARVLAGDLWRNAQKANSAEQSIQLRSQLRGHGGISIGNETASVGMILETMEGSFSAVSTPTFFQYYLENT